MLTPYTPYLIRRWRESGADSRQLWREIRALGFAHSARTVRRFIRVTEQGLRILADRPPEASERLREVHDAYAFFEREVPALVERFKDAQIRGGPSTLGEPAPSDRIPA